MNMEIQILLDAVKQIKGAFGAPGDYGYGTKEGKALIALYGAAWALENAGTRAAAPACPHGVRGVANCHVCTPREFGNGGIVPCIGKVPVSSEDVI